MKKKFLILIIATLLPQVARAGDFPALSRAWEAQRDAASLQVVRLWLSGAQNPLLQEEILRFVGREIKLSILDPDCRIFVSDPEFKHQEVPVSLLMVLLKESGIDLDPTAFFTGKKFLAVTPKRGERYADR